VSEEEQAANARLDQANRLLAEREADYFVKHEELKPSERAHYVRGFCGGIAAVSNIAILLELIEQREARKPEMDSLKSITTYEEAMAQLRVFWGAERRPWFCRVCSSGYLQPIGKDGYRCKDCGVSYGRAPPGIRVPQ